MSEDIKVDICGEERVVRHRWKTHTRGWVLTSSLLKGTQQNAGKPLNAVISGDEQLRAKGREHVETIRQRASKRGNQTAAAAAAAAAGKGKRKGADAALFDPLAAGTTRGGGTRSGATPKDSRHEALRFGLLFMIQQVCDGLLLFMIRCARLLRTAVVVGIRWWRLYNYCLILDWASLHVNTTHIYIHTHLSSSILHTMYTRSRQRQRVVLMRWSWCGQTPCYVTRFGNCWDERRTREQLN